MINKPIIYVEWVDSHVVGVGDTWREVSHIEIEQDIKCYTVGFLIKENKECMIISSNMAFVDHDTDFQVAGTIMIPKQAVVELKYIKE